MTNVAPTAVFHVTSPINEGGSSTLTLSDPDDPSSVDELAGFQYRFACNDEAFGPWGTSNTASCPYDDGDSTQYVKGEIKDKDGGITRYTESVHVDNVAPTPSIDGAPSGSPEGTEIDLTEITTDPSTADTDFGFVFTWTVTKDGAPYASGTNGPDRTAPSASPRTTTPSTSSTSRPRTRTAASARRS